MAELNAVYSSIDDIPETVDFRDLFAEKNGKYELTGIKGVKTQADIERLQVSLAKEREEHKAARDRLGAWGDLDHEEVMSKLDRMQELEAAAEGKLDDAAIDELANKRAEGLLRTKLGPMERQLKKFEAQNAELAEQNSKFQAANIRRTIHDDLRKALIKAKVRPEAYEDALMLGERVFEVAEEGVLTKDGVGVTPGLRPSDWLAEIEEKRPHWWPDSVGGGARGTGAPGSGLGGANPWSSEHWNLTKQGTTLREKGTEYAERLAQAAGTTVGGAKPKAKKGS